MRSSTTKLGFVKSMAPFRRSPDSGATIRRLPGANSEERVCRSALESELEQNGKGRVRVAGALRSESQ